MSSQSLNVLISNVSLLMHIESYKLTGGFLVIIELSATDVKLKDEYMEY